MSYSNDLLIDQLLFMLDRSSIEVIRVEEMTVDEYYEFQQLNKRVGGYSHYFKIYCEPENYDQIGYKSFYWQEQDAYVGFIRTENLDEYLNKTIQRL